MFNRTKVYLSKVDMLFVVGSSERFVMIEAYRKSYLFIINGDLKVFYSLIWNQDEAMPITTLVAQKK